MLNCHRLFTPPKAGHSKSVCDGVGGNFKTEVKAVALAVHGTSENITIHSADDVKKVITAKNNLTYDVLMYQSIKTDQ